MAATRAALGVVPVPISGGCAPVAQLLQTIGAERQVTDPADPPPF